MAIFTADGHFVILNINPDTPKFAANARNQGTPEENKAAVLGAIGLYGTYKVVNKDLQFHILGSTYPNWDGTDQKRQIDKFSHDQFTWAATTSLGGKGAVTWQRVK